MTITRQDVDDLTTHMLECMDSPHSDGLLDNLPVQIQDMHDPRVIAATRKYASALLAAQPSLATSGAYDLDMHDIFVGIRHALEKDLVASKKRDGNTHGL